MSDLSDDTLTESQAARRGRILDAALELSTDGGFDAVQMREVAARADVALGTLYRYFPSKENLLLSVMGVQVEALADRLARRPPEGTDPVERVVDVLDRANRALQRQPDVTVAMVRALVSGGADLAPVVSANRDSMRRIISDALGTSVDADPGTDLAVDLLNDIWLAALVAWIAGSQPAESVMPKLEAAARALLG
jgi:AcrR family transcriptional regulator